MLYNLVTRVKSLCKEMCRHFFLFLSSSKKFISEQKNERRGWRNEKEVKRTFGVPVLYRTRCRRTLLRIQFDTGTQFSSEARCRDPIFSFNNNHKHKKKSWEGK